MNIKIENQSRLLKRIPYREINFIIEKILKDEKLFPNKFWNRMIKKNSIDQIEINIRLTDNKGIIEYNQHYFQRKSVTDVIAFSMIEGSFIPTNTVLGDIVINVEEAKKNSNLYHHSFKKELLLLVIHAILHLLGYEHDHENSLMRKREKNYWENVGYKDRS